MRDQAARVFWLFALFGAILLAMVYLKPNSAMAAVNGYIGFQGKLTNPDGTNVADTSYSVLFTLYGGTGCTPTGGAPCAAVWSETQSVTTADGIFQVNLGAVSAISGVDYNSSPLYLSLTVGADPEMSPRILFTTSPYAFNSTELGGIDSGGYVQLGQNVAAQIDSSTNASVFINKTGASGNILQLQNGGADVFSIANGGSLKLQNGTYTTNLALINNGLTSAVPAYPNAYTPTLSVRVSQTTGSRPLFFGYDDGTGTGWASYLTTGACGAFTRMCLDFGNGANAYTALENNGTTLQVGGGDDGNFTNVNFMNTGTTSFAAAAAPTVNQVSISNTGYGVATNNVNGLRIDYVGGAGAIESGGARIDLSPGITSGSTWNGMRIVANATGAVSGVYENGIKLVGPTTPGAGTEVGMVIDANWDAGLQLGSKTSAPGTPPANNIYVYARSIAGRDLLRQKAPSGVSFSYQPAMFEQAITYQGPNTAATVTTFGASWTVDTTGSHPAATETYGYATNFATAGTTNDTSGVYQTNVSFFRGSVAGANGFFFVSRMGLPDAGYGAGATGCRIYTGLTNQTLATMTGNDNPAGNWAGFQYSTNRADANWQFMTKDNVTQNRINTNMAFTVAKVYDFYIYTPPQGATVYWRVDNLTDGTTQEGSTAVNLPTSTVAMRGGSLIQTLTNTARNIRVMKHYIEADR